MTQSCHVSQLKPSSLAHTLVGELAGFCTSDSRVCSQIGYVPLPTCEQTEHVMRSVMFDRVSD